MFIEVVLGQCFVTNRHIEITIVPIFFTLLRALGIMSVKILVVALSNVNFYHIKRREEKKDTKVSYNFLICFDYHVAIIDIIDRTVKVVVVKKYEER